MRKIRGFVQAAAVLGIVAVPLGVGAADVFVGTPPFNPDNGQQVSIQLFVDVGPDVLGSYFFDFGYDPLVVNVFAIDGGTTAEFSSPPTTDPGSFASGTTPLAEAQGSTTSPTGFVSVATLTLDTMGLPGDFSDLDLTVHSLFDGELDALPATVFPSSLLVAMPEAATDLVFDTANDLSWSASPDITMYNLYRGSFGASGFAYNHGCLDGGLVTPAAMDATAPSTPGTAFYYLIAAERNQVEGSLGTTSSGQTRPDLSPCVSGASALTLLVEAPAAGADGVVHLGEAAPASADGSSVPAPVRSGSEDSGTVTLSSDGDLNGNGRLDGGDAEWILQSVVGARALDAAGIRKADVNGDGAVTVSDAQLVRRFLAPQRPHVGSSSLSGSPALSVVLGSSDCRSVDLQAGLNAVRLRCLPEDYGAFEMLEDLGASAAVAIQYYDREAGRYLTARLVDGQPAGEDFPVRAVESYLIQLVRSVPGFIPGR